MTTTATPTAPGKVRVKLLSNADGLIHGNRLARPGDVLELEPEAAADLVRRHRAEVRVFIRIVKAQLLVGTAVFVRGETAEVLPEKAEQLIKGGFAIMAPCRVLKDGLMVDGCSLKRGALVNVPPRNAVVFILEGVAESAPDAPVGKLPPDPTPVKVNA